MTLNNWVKNGNPMLSNWCAAWCCQEIGCNEKQLRDMHIHDIYALAPVAGKAAKREIDRWSMLYLSKIANADHHARPERT
jgi:hypothetical protein